MGPRLLGALLGGVVGWGCAIEPFHCTDDQQCVENGVTGQCQANQYCTFPDDACPSGQRYAESAGGGLGGTCLPVDESMGTESAGDGSGSGGGTSNGGPGESTGVADDATAGDTRPDSDDDDSNDDDSDPGAYPPCVNIDECSDPEHVCLEPELEDICVPPCGSSGDCPEAPGGNAPVCTESTSAVPGVCVIPCSSDSDCPGEMECIEDDLGLQIGGELCAWD